MDERANSGSRARARMGRLTAWEIVDAFPEECGAILPRELRRIRHELKGYFDHIEDIREDYIDDFERDFFIAIVWMFMPRNKRDLYRNLLKIYHIYKMRKKVELSGSVKLNVELARAKPIEELYDFEKTRVARKYITALCPFHNEKTPSFYIYTDDNKYHCFGCGVHGDSIDFIKAINGYNFVDAVKLLMGS